jgi:hypothetical protein
MRRSLSGLIAFALLGLLQTTGTVPAGAAPVPSSSCNVFPSDNIWNTDISALPVNARSAQWLASMAASSTNLHPDFGGPPYGFPFNVVDNTHALHTVNFDYADESDAGPYPVGADTLIENGSDRHALIINKDTCTLYELFDLSGSGTSWTAGSGAIFPLGSDSLRPLTWTSADAAGLPIFPGLVRWDEVQAGAINHAIRFTAQQSDQSFLWPARHQAGSAANPALPPMGARFRLKAGYDISHFSAQAQVILRAMQHYGLILADNGSNWFFSGTEDANWPDSLLSELKTVPASQFEAVDESMLQSDPNSAAIGSWEGLGGRTNVGPASSSSGSRLDVFAIGTDNQPYQRTFNGTSWSSWNPLGGRTTAQPAAVARSGGIDLLMQGTDGALWWNRFDGIRWLGWQSLGGRIVGGPAVASWSSSRLDVVAAGTDGALWHRVLDNGAWSGWESLGGRLTSNPAAVSWAQGRLDLFARATDNALWHRAYDASSGGWSGWESLGGQLASAPAATSWGANRIDVFAQGTDGAVYRRSFSGSWQGWSFQSGPGAGNLSATARSTGVIDLYLIANDHSVWHQRT